MPVFVSNHRSPSDTLELGVDVDAPWKRDWKVANAATDKSFASSEASCASSANPCAVSAAPFALEANPA